MGLRRRVSEWLQARKVRRYFRLPEKERVALIQSLFAQVDQEGAIEGYLAQRYSGKFMDRSPYYDMLLGYQKTICPDVVHQIGCFTASECRWLIDQGFDGTAIASDYDHDRLEFLRKRFATTRYAGIHFRHLDLERRDYASLKGATMVCGLAVLANVQPTSVDSLFAHMEDCGVALMIINDIATPESLSSDPNQTESIPSTVDCNWYHRFLALAAKYGTKSLVLPDFSPGTGSHARCIFVFSRGISDAVHIAAVARGLQSYIGRQTSMLEYISATSLPIPQQAKPS